MSLVGAESRLAISAVLSAGGVGVLRLVVARTPLLRTGGHHWSLEQRWRRFRWCVQIFGATSSPKVLTVENLLELTLIGSKAKTYSKTNISRTYLL